MHVMVFGATGFIGGQIARAAVNAGMEVHALRRRPGSVGAVGDLPIHWIDCDVDDSAALPDHLAGCEILFHAAGYAPGTEYNVRRVVMDGVRQFRGVMDAALEAGVRRVVYTSSLSTIAAPPPGEERLADERDGYLPGSTTNAYYEVKWLMELEALRYTHAGLPVISLAPTAVFGPGDVKPSTSAVLLMAAKGQFPVGIDIEVNVVDGRDVALAHIAAVEKGRPGDRYIIGGHNVHVGDALCETAEIAGVKPPRRNLSVRTMQLILNVTGALRLPVTATMRAIPYWQPLNSDAAIREFGYTPRSLTETIRDTLDWFRENGYF